MVPGMTERERLAADARLCAWLAESRYGPTLTAVSPLARVTDAERRPRLPLELGRRAFAAARALARLIGAMPAAPVHKLAGREALPTS